MSDPTTPPAPAEASRPPRAIDLGAVRPGDEVRFVAHDRAGAPLGRGTLRMGIATTELRAGQLVWLAPDGAVRPAVLEAAPAEPSADEPADGAAPAHDGMFRGAVVQPIGPWIPWGLGTPSVVAVVARVVTTRDPDPASMDLVVFSPDDPSSARFLTAPRAGFRAVREFHGDLAALEAAARAAELAADTKGGPP